MVKSKGINPEARLDVVVSRLASPDKVVRDKVRKSVKGWMRRHEKDLKYEDYMTLWKGLLYDLWLADKKENHEMVSKDLCKIAMPSLGSFGFSVNNGRGANIQKKRKGKNGKERGDQGDAVSVSNQGDGVSVSHSLASFFSTNQNQWDTLDRYRVEKFQYLVRLMAREIIFQARTSRWNIQLLRAIIRVLICVCPWFHFAGDKVPDEIKPILNYQRKQAARGCYLQFLQSWGEEWSKELASGWTLKPSDYDEAKTPETETPKTETPKTETPKTETETDEIMGDEKDAKSVRVEGIPLESIRLILSLFAKILASKRSDEESIRATYEKCLEPMLENCSKSSKKEFLILVGSMIFRISSMKILRGIAREMGVKMIEKIDKQLKEEFDMEIGYESLTPFGADFPDSFEMLDDEINL